ncbi:MAG: undecaprenyl-diphosphate phosphatase [Candidatus Altiarchaeota archaeon]|nr:undecaprenyl-diphosphate phosphatase [Candidatus Altiarchaeota archaeon]
MMDLMEYILLGILQGVTEWLPVSSSGQSMLALISVLQASPQTALRFAIYLHIGTLLAVLVKFRKDFKHILTSMPRMREDKITSYLLVSTIVTGLVGMPVYLLMKQSLGFLADHGELVTASIGVFLVLTGFFLYLSNKKFGLRGIENITLMDMVVGGIAQGFTIIPGVSRSGMTTATLLFLGLKQDTALKLSFLMSVPAVLGAVALDLLQGGFLVCNFTGLVAAVLTSFIVGYATMDLLIRFSRRIRFDVFCVFFGLIAVVVSMAGLL